MKRLKKYAPQSIILAGLAGCLIFGLQVSKVRADVDHDLDEIVGIGNKFQNESASPSPPSPAPTTDAPIRNQPSPPPPAPTTDAPIRNQPSPPPPALGS